MKTSTDKYHLEMNVASYTASASWLTGFDASKAKEKCSEVDIRYEERNNVEVGLEWCWRWDEDGDGYD